jgi:hypothetical protein
VLVNDVTALGYETLTVYPAGGPPEASTVRADEQARTLENEYVRVTLDEAGEITSLIHKLETDDGDDIEEREIIAPAKPPTP